MSRNAPDTCHDCACFEGEIHDYGCDMERCPFCGGQLLSCNCAEKLLNLEGAERDWTHETGLTKEQEEKWLRLLNAKGRVPYILFPNLCGYCGQKWPEMFIVPDKEWRHYIPQRKRNLTLCRPCYDWIKTLVDTCGLTLTATTKPV